MNILPTPLSGLYVVATTPAVDDRGRFERIFCADELAAIRPGLHFPQINLSRTDRRGTVRGMHFQAAPGTDGKLIRCVRGRVFDVAVDIRRSSPTYLRWHAVELGEDGPQLFIPEGFAHGFQALTDDVAMVYMHTAAWNRDLDRTLPHDDPALAIAWPLPVTRISAKDRTAAPITTDFEGLP